MRIGLLILFLIVTFSFPALSSEDKRDIRGFFPGMNLGRMTAKLVEIAPHCTKDLPVEMLTFLSVFGCRLGPNELIKFGFAKNLTPVVLLSVDLRYPSEISKDDMMEIISREFGRNPDRVHHSPEEQVRGSKTYEYTSHEAEWVLGGDLILDVDTTLDKVLIQDTLVPVRDIGLWSPGLSRANMDALPGRLRSLTPRPKF